MKKKSQTKDQTTKPTVITPKATERTTPTKAKKMKSSIILAKDCKCHRCAKQAMVFIGLADPDGTDYPMCRSCVHDWKMEVIMALSEMKK